MKGYSGKILHVNLTTAGFEVEQPLEGFYRQYVGGACMGNYYVFKGMKAGVDPLGPDNVLVFSISAVVGAPISGNARHTVSAKSPQTGTIGSSEGGGFWGPEAALRRLRCHRHHRQEPEAESTCGSTTAPTS